MLHSSPNKLHANASDAPHWPAPVSVASRFVPATLVEISLRHGRVDLVAAGGTDALVFVINVRRRVQRLFQSHRAQQRRGPPQRINVAHRFGDFDPRRGADFLLDEVSRENRLQRFRRHRLFGARMQRRRQRFGKIGVEVIPCGRNVRLHQIETGFLAHNENWLASILVERR